MKSKIALLVLLLILTGCGKETEPEKTIILTETNSGGYTYVIPFKSSNTRSYHGTYQSRYDIVEIGIGMEERSKEHFSVKDYYIQEGTIISRDMLSSLVKRESETNTQGLNPSKGSSFYTGNMDEAIADPVIVTDVFELDFIKKNDSTMAVSGMTIAIVVNQNQKSVIDGVERSTKISDERIWEYASNAGRKLESYLRTLESVVDIPVCILIYNTVSSDAILPGGFIGAGYFSGRTGQFTRIEEKWVLIPTTEANTIDSATYNTLLNIKNALKEFLPENVGIMGQARYISGDIDFLKIQISAQAKTYAEIRALTQYCAQLIGEFNSGMRLVVHIKSNDETVSIIERNKDSNEIITTYLN